MSSKLQRLSLLICSQGILEESFKNIADIVFLKGLPFLSFNLYFEAYVSSDSAKEKTKSLADEIHSLLEFNKVEVNCWRTELYKKK